MTATHSKTLILGSGPAGYCAGIYAARAMLEPVLISGLQPGGQLTITTDVENYPGFKDVIQGPWLMEQMRTQAENMGVTMVDDHVVAAEVAEGSPFRLTGDSGAVYTCDSLIICTGAQAKWLGLDSEAAFKGFGVSACATCDGFFYRGKKVLVVGGGNTAVEEALFLTNFASEVVLVHRRDSLRAEKILQQRLAANPAIRILWNTVVEEICGDDDPKTVTGVRLRRLDANDADQIFFETCQGVFVAIGHAPATALFTGQLDMTVNGYIATAPDSTATSRPGVFAAGDVTDEIYRQAVTAAAMGCMAALEAEKFLAGKAV